MDIQASKIELAKLILNLENPLILEKIKELIQGEVTDVGITLTDLEKQEIEIAINQLNQGKRTSFSDYLKKVS